ncbi:MULTISPECIES: SDR family NAD(P)-dependent oxidoreductase [Azospirillum]|uniref:3-oxoacyl-[acyl-carrier protein] reductase n=1 Tax=Azospirillum rugosum TaxID=416170 RepID=A0ABS4SFI5_9PROT|nr:MULTISPECIES: SDR family NAD(P)-dependent oxidoreductase [Azospirillum]MBP2291326.1 3-oxoacyl-[acyl-carrier protein] reductase [Azospirillum rugosum]MCW2238449.1 3-oxoacyl-[acyl-carrier protein] reductase [Azospirillum canadense]MDQ0525114.1 3-oxoacyl-[acyl-carrier protein] reductase [Azospirillum rugosum]
MNLGEDLRGKRVLVTGSSRGIGAAVGAALAGLGARVALHGSGASDAAARLAADLRRSGADVHAFTGDFRDPRAVESVVDSAVEALGGLDILINNAGTMVGRMPLGALDDRFLDEVIDLNLRSVVVACRRALPALKAAGGGVIVSTVSISAKTGGSPGSSLYSASKAFVSTFTRSLAAELAPDRIRVNAVSPGTIDTDFHQRYSSPEKLAATAARIPLGRLGTAEDCVGAYLFLASDALSAYITGQVIEVNGGQLMV